MAHVRGIHEISELQKLRRSGPKADAAKLTAKLARLDHQRMLLDRQLTVWTEKRQVTEQRLGMIEKQMEQIGRLIRELVVPHRTAKQHNLKGAVVPGQPTDGAVTTERHYDISVEY